jgi:hypothetical protein
MEIAGGKINIRGPAVPIHKKSFHFVVFYSHIIVKTVPKFKYQSLIV